jgi:threonylcarbamoyladenosine tRNA methylthiotransferase MtaB
VASFYVQNFGCRATQADGAAIEHQFASYGLKQAERPHQAQIVVLNTCTVTAAADRDARAAIRRIHRENPACQIVVTGCYAQRAPEEIAALPGVYRVVGNSHKHRLAELSLPANLAKHRTATAPSAGIGFVPLTALANDRRPATDDQRLFVSDIFAHTELLAAPVFDAAHDRTRPNLKVQDGCDNRCSFCVIPYVRGQSRSLRLEEVIREVRALVDAGYREVVISGINLGRWGRDLSVLGCRSSVLGPRSLAVGIAAERRTTNHERPGFGQRPTTNDRRRPDDDRQLSLEDLVRSILNETSLEKLRISSVEPMDWTESLIRLVAESPRIAKHAHVPMQSGSDRILRAMHRKYRPWHYRDKILRIRGAMPTAAIGADVMVGFPGETEADFEATRRMVEELPFTYLHVFTYSSRPGTPAANFRNQVPIQIARERNRLLRELATRKKLAFMESFVGKTIEAITLISGRDGACPVSGTRQGASLPIANDSQTEALADNYLMLKVAGQHEANQWITVQVEKTANGELIGFRAA